VAAVKRAAPDIIGVVLVAAGVLVVVGHVFPNFDAFYALVWGRDLIHGRTPDYFAPGAPAAHPLLNATAAFAALFGKAPAVDLMRLAGPLAVGALCVGLFRLGQALYGWPVGLVAAALFATRAPTLALGAQTYIDLPTTALIVWAAVLEARRPRRGFPVLVLLGLAGLLRPEVWLMAGVYWIWVLPGRDTAERIGLGALALAGPLLWVLSDLAVTGDALSRFHSLHATIPETRLSLPETRTGLLSVPDAVTRDLGNFMRPVPLAMAVGGLVAGVACFRRQTLLPAAVAVLNTAAVTITTASGAAIEQRYLFPTAAMLAIFAGVLAVGWLELPRGSRLRLGWSAAAVCGLVGLVAFAVSDVRRIDRARSALAAGNRAENDLRGLTERHSAERTLQSVRLVYVQTARPLPFLAFWTGRRTVSFSTAPPGPATDGALVAPRTEIATRYLTGKGPLPASGAPPAGYRVVASSASWTLYAGDRRDHAAGPLGGYSVTNWIP
jgi:hypothetical protein